MRKKIPRRGNVPKKIASLASMGGVLSEAEWPDIWECDSTSEVLEKVKEYELDASLFIPRTSAQSAQEDRAYVVAFGYRLNVSPLIGVNYDPSPVIYFAYAMPHEVERWRSEFRRYRQQKQADTEIQKAIQEAEEDNR